MISPFLLFSDSFLLLNDFILDKIVYLIVDYFGNGIKVPLCYKGSVFLFVCLYRCEVVLNVV